MKFIHDEITSKRPLLAMRYSSEQYLLSKEILFLKHKKGLSSRDIAAKINMNLDDYLEFEGGYTNHSIEAYFRLIGQLRKLDKRTVL